MESEIKLSLKVIIQELKHRLCFAIHILYYSKQEHFTAVNSSADAQDPIPHGWAVLRLRSGWLYNLTTGQRDLGP